MAGPTKRRRLRRRITVWAVGALTLGIAAFLIWCSIDYDATAAEYDAVEADAALVVTSDPVAIVLEPADGATGAGLVFVPGAKVTAEAYAYKLSALAGSGVTVIITRPILNLAFFDLRPLDAFTDLAPDVRQWYVGGHSLGGVKACQFASDPAIDGLVLFGSYCANDLSETDVRVLSLSASNDGLSTPDDIASSADYLPADATFIEIPRANHAQFGNYGLQPGDGDATIDDEQVREQIDDALLAFVTNP